MSSIARFVIAVGSIDAGTWYIDIVTLVCTFILHRQWYQLRVVVPSKRKDLNLFPNILHPTLIFRTSSGNPNDIDVKVFLWILFKHALCRLGHQ